MSATPPDDPLWRTVWSGIDGFLERWQAATRQALDPETRAAAFGLLHAFRHRSLGPADAEDYGLHFGPLLCSGDAERQLFDALWSDYWNEAQDREEPTEFYAPSAEKPRRKPKIAAWLLVLGLWLAAAGLGYHYYRILQALETVQTFPKPPKQTDHVITNQAPVKPTIDAKPFLKDLPLREPPPALTLSEADRQALNAAMYYVLGAAALIVAAALALLWRQRKLVFQSLAALDDDPSSQPLKLNAAPPGGDLAPGYRRLSARLRFAEVGGKHIHWRKTVAATVRAGGFPSLRYRVRRRQADFVLIADCRHRRDQAAWLLASLRQTLLDAGVGVRSYDFDRHPEWLWPEGRRDVKPVSIEQVLGKQAGSRLLLAVDAEVLSYRLNGELQGWVKKLQPLPNYRLLLLSRPDPEQARQLAHGRYPYRALDDLSDLAPLLDFDAALDPLPSETPAAAFRDDWLGNRPPEALAPMFGWLGQHDRSGAARRLLAALALYPALQGDLTLALYRHFAVPGAPEPLLKPADWLKTAALPWCRRGCLPDWLRQALLADMPKADYRHTRRFFQILFGKDDAPKGRPIALELNKPLPFWRRLRLRVRIRRAKPGSVLRDRIFARVLLSPHNPFGRLSLPARLANALPNALLSQAGSGLLLTALAACFLAGVYGLWQWQGADFYAQRLLNEQAQRHRDLVVELRYKTEAQPLLIALGKGLSALGYRVASRVDETLTENRVVAPAAAIDDLAAAAEYLSWGGAFALATDPGQVRIDLAAMPQTGQVFRDVKPKDPVRLEPYPPTIYWQTLTVVKQVDTVLREQPAFDPNVRPIEPRMVKIPAGLFLMGSPKNEPGRYDDEGPQHKVNVAAFSIADAEVTFEEWDMCVKAKACRDVDDQGWGRGQRPVINVSWNDAQIYIQWLNQTLGLTGAAAYRLPSEVEWEYAARAGTTTAFFWGNGSSCNYANGDDARQGCKDGYAITAPVRSFKPNDWNLYDMSGNVWEWVEDCRYDNYSGAPANGSAWLGTDCRYRSIRGASWLNEPPNLRSANRDGFRSDDAEFYLGFRLARTD